MLDEYCNKLSDAAQLKIALRLGKLVLPVWSNYFSEHADAIEKVNALVISSNRMQSGAKQIKVDFPAQALEIIEKSYEKAAKDRLPVAAMRKDPQLPALLATSMQPLTNPDWDDTLPYTVRLVFTSVWNILTWIAFRQKNNSDETHIYVAINQAADALMSEKILTVKQIDAMLLEYKDETRGADEDATWQASPGETSAGDHGLNIDEIYRKIAGEYMVKDPPPRHVAQEILRQMREEGKSFWDEWEEYYHGTCNTYSYNHEMKSYWRTEVDVIVGSFYNEYPMSENEMLEFISGISLNDLRESGFEV